MKPTLLFPLTLATALLPQALRAEETNNWSFEIAPYLWVAGLSAEASLPQPAAVTLPEAQGLGAAAAASVQEFDTRLSGGLMLAAQARYRSVGLFMDFNWLRLDTESLNPGTLYSGVHLRSDYIYATAALTYELPLRGRFHAEVEAGARLWSVGTDFQAQTGDLPGFQSSQNETWVSGLIGLNLRYDLSRHWYLATRGTVGGFTESNVQWDLFGGVGYQFNRCCSVVLGYRYLHEEHNQDNFTFNADAHGCLLGFGFRF